MNAESNPAFPKQAKTTLGERFKTVIVDLSALTRGVADDVERAMATLRGPSWCSVPRRLGGDRVNLGVKAKENKWSRSGALQRAREMGLKFFAAATRFGWSYSLRAREGSFVNFSTRKGVRRLPHVLGDPVSGGGAHRSGEGDGERLGH